MADLIGGDTDGALTDLVDIPMTAHFLGGCAIGATAQDGVIDVVRTSGERSENTTVSMLRSSPRRARR